MLRGWYIPLFRHKFGLLVVVVVIKLLVVVVIKLLVVVVVIIKGLVVVDVFGRLVVKTDCSHKNPVKFGGQILFYKKKLK